MRNLIIKARQEDKKALEEIIEKFRPLINNTAISFYIYGHDSDDIKQIAILSIINAINKFDITKEELFTAYVKKCVKNSMYKEIEKATKVYYKDKESKEISQLLEEKDIISDELSLQDKFIKKEEKQNLEKAISLLEDTERKLLKELYVENKTLADYAKENNIEYHKVRYIKETTIKKLKILLK
ncbi:sigma-70 family RNA polymerase sigma factor [Clostridium sp. Sa3CUN1]|uniref:Sigma-70 family RNA polymerase sigma factor n=1 Tax=Clostridium gallinarum TaxID=2762246 RepID=A0ABR8Q2V5_9CLOT|nr:sigma-70 family RNA polymerase sigma factor [Clostridium gallinarum]MBD7914729.1 sigma-70 family RNA polymerase sigma factor [Clostridium gallinarum]